MEENSNRLERSKKSSVEIYLNTLARQLREYADKDYITARMCYFNGLLNQFFWHTQQSIE